MRRYGSYIVLFESEYVCLSFASTAIVSTTVIVLVSFVAIFAIIQIVGPERLQELVQAKQPHRLRVLARGAAR